MLLDESTRQALRHAVQNAALRPDVRDAVSAVYQSLQDAIDLRSPVCDASGRCCRFEGFGHSLFVTTLELAAFVGQANLDEREATPSITAGGCRFQIGGKCSVRAIRPFGCRVFYCDPTSADWQAAQYERLHGHLRKLHDALKVPYFYVEWRQGLVALGLLDADRAQSLLQSAVLL